MATRNIVPRATGEGTIGTATKKWLGGWINALVVVTINALTLTAQAVGFTIAGGTTSKTLTVPLDASVSGTNTGDVAVADQTDMEAGTEAVQYVTPAIMQFHPSAAKFWLYCAGAGTGSPGLANYNVTSFADTGTGLLTITIATDFSSVNWCCQVTVEIISDALTEAANVQTGYIKLAGQAAGTVVIASRDTTATTAVLRDPKYYHVAGFGDQA
jgi:hypothetical protein